MNFLAAVLAAVLKSVLETYGHLFGKTRANDAPTNRGALSRAGRRVRQWLRARDAGIGGRADSDRSEH